MKRGAEAEVDLIKFMTDVRKGASSKKQDAHAKVFAHDLKQQQLAALQSMNPDGANFEDECRKAKPLADKLTDMVATDILASSNKKEMVRVIEFYLKVAHESLKAGDYQSALFLSTAVEGLEIDRLGINQDVSKEAKAQLAEIRGRIDNNARFQQFNQFLKTQNGPNIVPITSSIQAQYVALKEKKTLAETDEVKESLETGINETKGILRNYVQNAHPEPMQSNLMTKLSAPTLPYDTAYAAGDKDQPEPLSMEGRSRILKQAGQPFNPNTPEAKASTAAVTQFLKTQPASATIEAYNQLKSEAVEAIAQHQNHEASRVYRGRPDSSKRYIHDDRWARQDEIYLERINELGAKIEAMERQFPGLKTQKAAAPVPTPPVAVQAAPVPTPPVAVQAAPIPTPPVAASSSDKGKEEEIPAAAGPSERKARKERKTITDDDDPVPIAAQQPAADEQNQEEKVDAALLMEPVEPAAAEAKSKQNNDLNLMDLAPAKASKSDAKQIATALMKTNIEMAQRIPASEIVNNQWESPNTNIDRIVKHTVAITERVRDSVLLAGSKEAQIKTFRFMLDVMNESLKAGDVNTAMAIYQGLDNTPVNRLKYIAQDKKNARDFHKAETFFSPELNCKNIRDYTNQLAQKGKPVVPSIALFTKDLTFARDGNRTDFKLNEEGEKQLSTIFENFKRSENANVQSASRAGNNPPIVEQWLNAPRLTEKEADDHSALIKPRGVDVPYLKPVPSREQVLAAVAAADAAFAAPIAQQPAAPAAAAPQPAAPSVQENKGKENAAGNNNEELKSAEPVKARKIKIPKRVEGQPSGPAPLPPSGSNEPVAQQAPKTPQRKTVRFADDVKSQEPSPIRERIKAQSKAYKESVKGQQNQVSPQPPAPLQPTAASVAAGLDPIIKDAKETDAKSKAETILNGLSKVNAPQVKISDAGKIEFTVNGIRNTKALQKTLKEAGIDCQVTKGKGGTTFSFDAEKLNALSFKDIQDLVKATRKEYKELTIQQKEKRKAAVVPEEPQTAPPVPPQPSQHARAEEAKQIAAALKEKAPPPPVVKVDTPAVSAPPQAAASRVSVDASAQLASMLNNPMPNSNITAPPVLETVNTNHPSSRNLDAMSKPPARRQQARAAVANANEDVKIGIKADAEPVVSSFQAAKKFWNVQDQKDMQAKQTAEQKTRPSSETGSKIKPT